MKGLTYVGPGDVLGVPARDLTARDIARLAWVRAGQPSKVAPSAINAIRDELVATGLYVISRPEAGPPAG